MKRRELAEECEREWIKRSAQDPSMSAFVEGFLEGLDAGFSIKDPARLAQFDPSADPKIDLSASAREAEESAKAFNEWRNNHPRTVMTKAEFDRRVMSMAAVKPAPDLANAGTFPGYGANNETRIIETAKPQQGRVSAFLQTIFKNK